MAALGGVLDAVVGGVRGGQRDHAERPHRVDLTLAPHSHTLLGVDDPGQRLEGRHRRDQPRPG